MLYPAELRGHACGTNRRSARADQLSWVGGTTGKGNADPEDALLMATLAAGAALEEATLLPQGGLL